MKKETYLDWAATSYKKPPAVVKAVKRYLEAVGVSSGRGAYKKAFTADRIVYECRKEAAKLFGVADPARIVMTSGATEAINLALKGYLQKGDHIVTTSLEHNAVIRTLHRLKKSRGVSYTVVKCDKRGYFNLSDFENSINSRTKLFAVNHASNVTGTILPVRQITKIAKKHNIKTLVDAAQSAGSIEVNAERLAADFLAFAGHKSLLGPQGTGGLYIREGVALNPLKEGGTGSDSKSLDMPGNLPERFEAGTLNYPGISGLNEGLKYINAIGIKSIREKELAIIEYMLDKLISLDNITLYGCKNAKDIVGVFAFNLDGVKPDEAAHILDAKHDIMVRSGLHCAPLAHESIGTVNAGTMRASIGYATTKSDVDRLIAALRTL